MSTSTRMLFPGLAARRGLARDGVRLTCLGLACAAAMPVLLNAVAQSVRSLLALPPAWWGPAQLSAAITALACAAGLVGALWHLLSAAVALVILHTSAPANAAAEFQGHNAGAAVRLLRRWGAPLVRRMVGGVLVVGITTSPALAATDSAPDTDDLGWQPTVNAPAQPGESEVGEPADSEPQPGEPADPEPDATASATASPAASAPAITPPATQTTARVPLLPDAELPNAQLTTPHRPSGTVNGAPTAAGGASATAHRVAVGESLWSITAGLLGPEAATADIAAAWPQLYQANLETIGADPGLIRPGMLLTVPALTDPSGS